MVNIATLASDFMIGYTTLISIINPFGVAFIFYDMTRRLDDSGRQAAALRIAVYSFLILVVSAVLGSFILNFFGISIAALRIAGGLAVAFAGWDLLNRPEAGPDGVVPQQDLQQPSIDAMTFYPLTMPLTTGPGSVSAAIALAVSGPFSSEGILSLLIQMGTISVAVSLTIYVCYRWSGWLTNRMGVAATRIFTRVSAFLLLCVGVQIIITGVVDVVRTARGLV